jgi:hypothetical protein
MDNKVARLSIDLLSSDHKRLKTVASLMGITMKDLVVISIGDFMQQKLNEFNEVQTTEAKKSKKKHL